MKWYNKKISPYNMILMQTSNRITHWKWPAKNVLFKMGICKKYTRQTIE